MRTLDEMCSRSNDVISRATERGAQNIPTPLEVKLAHDNLRLISLIRHAEKLIATGFIDEWEKILRELGIK